MVIILAWVSLARGNSRDPYRAPWGGRDRGGDSLSGSRQEDS